MDAYHDTPIFMRFPPIVLSLLTLSLIFRIGHLIRMKLRLSLDSHYGDANLSLSH